MSEITLQYTLYDDYASVSGCGDEGDTAIIASSYEGKPVTYIEPEVFQSKTITNLYVPNTITKMGFGAFIYANITNVYYTSIEQICNMELEPYSYYPLYKEYCTLANPIYWAQNLYINNELLTELTIPETITVIKYGVFAGAQQLTKIIIPATVTKIQTAAFVGTSSLTYLEVQGDPDLYRYYGDYDRGPFYNCSGYKTAFTLKYLTLSSSTLEDHISLISTNCRSKQQTIEINTSTVDELNNFLSYNSKIVSVSLPVGLKKIRSSLYNCSNLISVILPDGLEQLYYSLHDCNSLTTISIPATIKHIEGDYWTASCFANCPNLSYYSYNNINYLGNSTLPYLVACGMTDATQESYILADTTKILYGTFRSNTYLTALTIPEGVISIGERTFYGCSGLTSIVIPDSVTIICEGAFSRCSGLTSIVIPDGVKSIGDRVFSNCSGLTSIIIPNSVTSIGWCAFSNCSGLTSIIIPNNVTSIGDCAFYECSSLTTVALSDNLIYIGEWAFYNTGYLDIIIPKSVTQIENNAFNHGTFYCETATKPIEWVSNWKAGGEAIWNCSPSLTNISIWDVGEYNLNINKKTNDNLISIYLDDILVKSLYTAGSYSIPITCISDESTIKIISKYKTTWGINSYILGDATKNSNLGELDFSAENNLISIENNAFENCSNLTNIELPSKVTTIGVEAFKDCTNLSTVKLPDDLKLIPENLFYQCSKLSYITLTYNVSIIENNAFANCIYLSQVTYIGDETDWNKIAIASGNDPLLVATRNYLEQAFDLIFTLDLDNKTAQVAGYSGAGSYIEIPEYYLADNIYYPVTRVGSNAFEDCTHLKTVYVLSSVHISDTNCNETWIYSCKLTSIRASAFKNCTSLTDIYLRARQTNHRWDFSGAIIYYQAFYNAPLNLDSFCPNYCDWQAMAGPKTIDYISGKCALWSESFIATPAGHAIISRIDNTSNNAFTDAEIDTWRYDGYYITNSFTAASINNLYLTTYVNEIIEWDYSGAINNIYYEGTETAWNKIEGHEKIAQTVQFSETALTAGNLKEQNELFYPYTTTEAVTDLTAKLNSLYSSISAIEDKLDIISEEFTSEDKTIAGNLYKYLYKKASDTVKYKLQAESAIEDEDGNNLIDTYCKIPPNKYSIPDSTATNVAQLRDNLNTIIYVLKAINILK